MGIFTPTLLIDVEKGRLERKEGLFIRRIVNLKEVTSVIGISRDSLTHEEIFIFFCTDKSDDFYISQFDKNFDLIVHILAVQFPGIEDWRDLSLGELFVRREKILWKFAREVITVPGSLLDRP